MSDPNPELDDQLDNDAQGGVLDDVIEYDPVEPEPALPELMDRVKPKVEEPEGDDPDAWLLELYPTMERREDGADTHHGFPRALAESFTKEQVEAVIWKSLEADLAEEDLSPTVKTRLRERLHATLEQHPSLTELGQTYGSFAKDFVKTHAPSAHRDADREEYMRGLYPNSNIPAERG